MEVFDEMTVIVVVTVTVVVEVVVVVTVEVLLGSVTVVVIVVEGAVTVVVLFDVSVSVAVGVVVTVVGKPVVVIVVVVVTVSVCCAVVWTTRVRVNVNVWLTLQRRVKRGSPGARTSIRYGRHLAGTPSPGPPLSEKATPTGTATTSIAPSRAADRTRRAPLMSNPPRHRRIRRSWWSRATPWLSWSRSWSSSPAESRLP